MDLRRALVTRPWKWWTMSWRWANRPFAARCSTRSSLIVRGSPPLFSTWAILSSRPTLAHAVRFKTCSSNDPNHPASRETPSIEAPSPASESPLWPPKRNARVMYICGLAFAPIPLRPCYGLGEGFFSLFSGPKPLYSVRGSSRRIYLLQAWWPRFSRVIRQASWTAEGTDAPATSQKHTTWSLGSKYVWPNHWLRRRASPALSGAPSDPAERK